jgi:putative hydrolase of the HAD superfamily
VAGQSLIVGFGAVIFDLYGTLVPEFPAAEFYETVAKMAASVGADPDAFRIEWDRTAVARQTGRVGSIGENVRTICQSLEVPEPSAGQVAEALQPRAEMYRRWLRPRRGAIETGGGLRERGFPLGLISMCAPDTPAMWRASPFAGTVDVEVFSSEVGLRKPEPAIYLFACERLEVEPASCLYCGDGSYRELTGANAIGMTAVEIRDPEVDIATTLHLEGDDWHGPRIADLRELLAMV